MFQSTLPRRERRYVFFIVRHPYKFQSTLPRRERLAFSLSTASTPHVSIHAPAKGATLSEYPLFHLHQCFNPRSREGSDDLDLYWFYAPNSFNPRSREGSDIPITKMKLITLVSIHAPAKGATQYRSCHTMSMVFQSTLPRRERQCIKIQLGYIL